MHLLSKLLFATTAVLWLSCAPQSQNQGGVAPESGTRAATVQPVYAARLLSQYLPQTFSGTPDNIITSLAWLQAHATQQGDWRKVEITPDLLPRSDRCQVDSLPGCLQAKIRAANIDPVDFQFTYFFDQAFTAGAGILVGSQRAFALNFEGLRRAGWQTGFRDFNNQYTCSQFKYRSKYPLDFIKKYYKKPKIFIPIEQAPFPNGQTVSGQGAVDWQTVTIDPKAFPLSVPDAGLRKHLARVYKKRHNLAPQPRSFLVIQTADGRQFLTEAMNARENLPPNRIAWRIGNNSMEIAYLKRLGDTAKVLCFTLQDAGVEFQTALKHSKR